MAEHMTLEDAINILSRAASASRVSLVLYDNPDTAGDERARLIQPTYIVQSKSNLLCAAWQYAPSSDWRLFHLRYFLEVLISPYQGLFRSAHTFDLDCVVSYEEYQRFSERVPYDRRSSRRRDIEVFYFDALAAVRGRAFKSGPLSYPECPYPYPAPA